MDGWDVKGMLHVMKLGTNHYYHCTIALFHAIITYTRPANTACHFWVVRPALGVLVRGEQQLSIKYEMCYHLHLLLYLDGITARMGWAADLASNMKSVII